MIFVLTSFQLAKWKKKQLGQVSTRQKLEDSSLFKLSKAGKILFKWLLVSTMGLLIFKHCSGIRWEVAM